MRWWWLSTERMSVSVAIDEDDVIVDAPPIVRKFIGQPITNLMRWLAKQPGYMKAELDPNGPDS
jgi:hypothetical protein